MSLRCFGWTTIFMPFLLLNFGFLLIWTDQNTRFNAVAKRSILFNSKKANSHCLVIDRWKHIRNYHTNTHQLENIANDHKLLWTQPENFLFFYFKLNFFFIKLFKCWKLICNYSVLDILFTDCDGIVGRIKFVGLNCCDLHRSAQSRGEYVCNKQRLSWAIINGKVVERSARSVLWHVKMWMINCCLLDLI